jgi:hypothetical protein
MNSIYIPGHGELSFAEFKVDRAVREYDDRLFFARNAKTWDWCVYISMPRPEEPYPVIGFGQEVPEVHEVLRRLHNADTMRHGWEIFDEIQKSQDDFKKKFAYNADQASEESAEVIEHFLRRHGKSPVIKSLAKGVSDNDA